MSSKHGSSHCRILLVEDNPADVALLRHSLAEDDASYELQVVRDGESALKLLKHLAASDRATRPGAVVLDLNLPRISGLELLRFLKSNPELKDLRVAVTTSSLREEDRASAEALGADLFAVKSLHLHDHFAFGRALMQLCERDVCGPHRKHSPSHAQRNTRSLSKEELPHGTNTGR